jgi:hypothetical protein
LCSSAFEEEEEKEGEEKGGCSKGLGFEVISYVLMSKVGINRWMNQSLHSTCRGDAVMKWLGSILRNFYLFLFFTFERDLEGWNG